jgi:hypothetical protein
LITKAYLLSPPQTAQLVHLEVLPLNKHLLLPPPEKNRLSKSKLLLKKVMPRWSDTRHEKYENKCNKQS